MAVDKLVDSAQLDSDLKDVADAIRAKSGGESPLAFPSGFISEIGNIPSGGATITDGIVVNSRNSSEFITSIDKYGNCGAFEFGIGSGGFRDFPYGYLETITLRNCTTLGKGSMRNRFIQTIYGLENIVRCGESCFSDVGMSAISLPAATYVGTTCFRNVYNTCKSILLPVLQSAGSFIFQSSTSLESVQIGSAGHPAPTNLNQPFYGCTQQGLTIIGYQTGANVDALVSNYRANATNATIIVKASEATTYNGTSYAAGDTILTSEVA